ncbi:MAG TPA: MraY family glycosyltransferase [Actinomycetota bacterium]|nr:MraY family glycosyltransferase [Actinomycetota bacterium]
MVTAYLAAFAGALASALLATPLARRVALRLGVLDLPAARKLHTDPVPYLGGLAIVAGFVVAAGVALASGRLSGSGRQLAVVLGGALVVASLGLWDDLRVSRAWVRLFVETAVALCLLAAGIRVELFASRAVDAVVTVAWVVGITNALNFMDNMDGLSAGVSAIAAASFFLLAALSGQYLVASLAAAVAGCALGFLWYNRPPARIFMGDTGALFLGFVLAVLGLKLRFADSSHASFLVPLAVLALPCLDTLLVTVARLRRGVSPITAGKDHVSHRLVALGIPSPAAVGLIYVVSASCGWLGLVIARSRPDVAYLTAAWLAAVASFLGWLLLRVRVEA